MVNTLAQAAPLTAADRCDRCGAQAQARFTLPNGLELLLCGHHTRVHAQKLHEAGAEVTMSLVSEVAGSTPSAAQPGPDA